MARITNDEKWAPVIGKLITVFGSVEHSINQMIQEMCAAPVAEDLMGSQLSRKIALLQRVIPTYKLLDGESTELLKLKEIEKLSGHRNTVAHYPLQLDVFSLHKEGMDSAERISRKPGDEKAAYIAFKQLVKHADEAGALSSKLVGCAIGRGALGFHPEKWAARRALRQAK